jgi:hypothetical protein
VRDCTTGTQPHVERVVHQGRALLPGGRLVREVERWRFGYVLELSLGQPMPGLEPQNYLPLFGADELRCVSSLRVELEQAQVEPLLDALERHRPPLTDLSFFISDTVAEFDDRLRRLWAALPGLRHLSFSRTRFAHINHPNLTTVSLLPDGKYTTPHFELVARSKLPALIRLSNPSDPPTPERLPLSLHNPSEVPFELLSAHRTPFGCQTCTRTPTVDFLVVSVLSEV